MLGSSRHKANGTCQITEKNWSECLAACAIDVIINSGGRPVFLRTISPQELANPTYAPEQFTGNYAFELETAKQAGERGVITMLGPTWKRMKEVSAVLSKYL